MIPDVPKPTVKRVPGGWQLVYRFGPHTCRVVYGPNRRGWEAAMRRANWLSYQQGFRVLSPMERFMLMKDETRELQKKAWDTVFRNFGWMPEKGVSDGYPSRG